MPVTPTSHPAPSAPLHDPDFYDGRVFKHSTKPERTRREKLDTDVPRTMMTVSGTRVQTTAPFDWHEGKSGDTPKSTMRAGHMGDHWMVGESPRTLAVAFNQISRERTPMEFRDRLAQSLRNTGSLNGVLREANFLIEAENVMQEVSPKTTVIDWQGRLERENGMYRSLRVVLRKAKTVDPDISVEDTVDGADWRDFQGSAQRAWHLHTRGDSDNGYFALNMCKHTPDCSLWTCPKCSGLDCTEPDCCLHKAAEVSAATQVRLKGSLGIKHPQPAPGQLRGDDPVVVVIKEWVPEPSIPSLPPRWGRCPAERKRAVSDMLPHDINCGHCFDTTGLSAPCSRCGRYATHPEHRARRYPFDPHKRSDRGQWWARDPMRVCTESVYKARAESVKPNRTL